MKYLLQFSALAFLLFSSCNSVVTNPPKAENIIPLDSILVDIPAPLSTYVSGARKSSPVDPIDGQEIYEALRVYIGFAEESAELIRKILEIIHDQKLTKPKDFQFTGDDGRTKEVSIRTDIFADGISWDYRINIQNSGGNMAFQFFWIKKPFQAFAILDLYAMDSIEHQTIQGMMMSIQVNRNKGIGVKRQQMVQVADHPKPGSDDSYLDNLKMLILDKGNLVEIMGNSNHPDMVLIDSSQTPGKSYSFVGRGSKSQDIGVVKLALPPSGLNNLQFLFEQYSVDTVLKSEILNLDPSFPIDTLNVLLQNARIPAYFNGQGFISAGPIPPSLPGFTNTFIDLSGLNPFLPKEVRDLKIDFLQ
jgi:hypothetical protein